jgi:uncharacterized protein (DUF362 family)
MKTSGGARTKNPMGTGPQAEPSPRSSGMKRRDFVRQVGAGTAGAAFFASLLGRWPAALSPAPGRTAPNFRTRPPCRSAGLGASASPAPPVTVSLVKGGDRRQIIYDALKPFQDEVFAAIGNKQVLIKPNMSVSKNPLAVTHPDAVRAVLEFLRPRHKKTVLIGESGVFNTCEGYKNNGYTPLEREYGVKLVDLNEGPYDYWYVFGKEQNPQPVRLVSPLLDPNTYIISLAPMKTHDCVLVTLSLKNVLMAAPLNDYRKSDKGLLHGPAPAVNDILHFNLFHLAHRVYPDLAVVDGFEAMEGNGPAWGTPFEARVALAGTDPLAVDVTATRVMGFDPMTVLYLSAMAGGGLGRGSPDQIRLTGTPLEECLYKFKANSRLIELYKLS